VAPVSEITLVEALREAADGLAQARAHAWGEFDALVGSDPQRAVDTLLVELEQRIGPLVEAVMRLGGDPRRCWL
jgi:hypothetical protein